MKVLGKNLSIFSWIFLLVGFAITAGSMIVLSEEFLLKKNQMGEMILPVLLLLVAGPFSLIAGFLLIDKFKHGIIFGLVTSGIFIFCSLAYFFQILINDQLRSMWHLLPTFIGISIAFAFIKRAMKLMRSVFY